MVQERRRSGKRVLSIALALVLAVLLGVVIVRELRGDAAPVTVSGVVGSEKLPFFADPAVKKVFADNGIELRIDPAGSRQIATTVDLGPYDFAFPSSAPAADKLLAAHPAARTYAPFSSPMAVATFRPIADLLTTAGVVTGTTFDMHRLLQLTATGTRWDQLPGNTAFPARKNVLLSTTEPCQSNSAAMYLGIASYAANNDAVVADQATSTAVLPSVEPLFRDQGYLPPSSEVLFEDYLSAGMGRVPMALVYEAQYLAEELAPQPTLQPGTVLLYPNPTVFSRHTLVPLTPQGDKVGELLTTNPDLLRLAAVHGFRTQDPRQLADVMAARGLPPLPQLVDVVEPPAYDTLEAMLRGLGCPA
ncbi:MAG: hypothetical protein ABS81_07115 [Pseudonocardia sp. SCN 72-86]|nr:MAG: hypothetical protein ABS81_07115 [Pseudonocardia sp. SCN 72-86]